MNDSTNSPADDPQSESVPVRTFAQIAPTLSLEADNTRFLRAQRFYLQSCARELMPKERVASCLKRIAPGSGQVQLVGSRSAGRSTLRNLIVCKSVWMCPVCSARITEQRRAELRLATAAAAKKGFYLVFVTYTLRHKFLKRDGALKPLLAGLLDAFRSLNSNKSWELFVKRVGWVGWVRSLEVTYGRNGWHPHLHQLVFLDRPVDLPSFEKFLKERWLTVLHRHGQDANLEHGCVVETAASRVTEYVAKFGHDPVEGWDVETELTKGPVKASLKTDRGWSMQQLLAGWGHMVEENVPEHDTGLLWREYARTFKGKQQVRWSRGLADALGVDKKQLKTDDQAAEDVQADDVLLAKFSREQWYRILGFDRRGKARAAVLDLGDHYLRTGDGLPLYQLLRGMGVDLPALLPDGDDRL